MYICLSRYGRADLKKFPDIFCVKRLKCWIGFINRIRYFVFTVILVSLHDWPVLPVCHVITQIADTLTCQIFHLLRCCQSTYPPLHLIPPPCIWNNHSVSMYQELSFHFTGRIMDLSSEAEWEKVQKQVKPEVIWTCLHKRCGESPEKQKFGSFLDISAVEVCEKVQTTGKLKEFWTFLLDFSWEGPNG